MARFGLSEIQADAILETKLYRLGKLEIEDILDELKARSGRGPPRSEALLDDEPARWEIIRDEIKADRRRPTATPGGRRIEGPPAPVEFREEDYIVDEDAWVIVTRDGWIKRQKSFTDVASIRVRDDDRVGWVYRARARQTLTFFTDRGIAYTLRVNDIPLTTGHGEPIQKQFAFEDQRAHRRRRLPRPALPARRSPTSPPPPAGPVAGACSTANWPTATANGDGATAACPRRPTRSP